MADPKSRIAVVVNGNAKSVNDDVISTIDSILRGGDLFVSRSIDEAPDIAQTIVARGYGTVLTGGGDGTFVVTVTEVVKAARAAGKPPPRFGLLKLGTGNALAWVVGASDLGKRHVSADVDRLLREAGSRRIHLVDVEGFLTPFAGLGADAQVLADYNRTRQALERTPLARMGRGLTGYGMAAITQSLPAFALQKMPLIRVRNDGGDCYPVDPTGVHKSRPIPHGATLFEGRMRMAALSTIPYYGFGMRLFPYAMARPGMMNLRLTKLSSMQFLKFFRTIWNGSYFDPSTTLDFMVERIVIECEPDLHFQIGGDSRGKRGRLIASVTESPVELVDYYEAPRG